MAGVVPLDLPGPDPSAGARAQLLQIPRPTLQPTAILRSPVPARVDCRSYAWLLPARQMRTSWRIALITPAGSNITS